MKKIKPLFVYVLWSESGEFEENSLLKFEDFERKAVNVGLSHDPEGGYYKTKINVLFDDGSEYGCRLDLCPNEAHGFRIHAYNFIRYYKQFGDSEENVAFLSSIDWN
jgi:hypothetical protein